MIYTIVGPSTPIILGHPTVRKFEFSLPFFQNLFWLVLLKSASSGWFLHRKSIVLKIRIKTDSIIKFLLFSAKRLSITALILRNSWLLLNVLKSLLKFLDNLVLILTYPPILHFVFGFSILVFVVGPSDIAIHTAITRSLLKIALIRVNRIAVIFTFRFLRGGHPKILITSDSWIIVKKCCSLLIDPRIWMDQIVYKWALLNLDGHRILSKFWI